MLHQIARVWANRWARAQARLPHNRCFAWRADYAVYWCKDSWLFSDFFEKAERRVSVWDKSALAYRDVPQTFIRPTELYTDFCADYQNARHPADSEAQVKPLKLCNARIEQLLSSMETWCQKPR